MLNLKEKERQFQDREYLLREVAQATKEATSMGNVGLIQKKPSELTGREETPRERMIRLRLFPTEADLRWARKGTSLGSPGFTEYWNSLLAWSKAHWPWVLGGTILYAGLLAAALRRGK